MSVDAVEGESDVLYTESNNYAPYYDYIAEKINSVATLCIQPFALSCQYLYTSTLPLRPGEFGQASSKVQEVACRIFASAFAIPTMLMSSVFFAIGLGLTRLANQLHSSAYRYVAGDYKDGGTNQPRIFSLNTAMLPSYLPYKYQGVTSANSRFERLVNTIRNNNPDFVFLADFNRGLGSSMVNALKDRYNHFAIDVGLNHKGLETGFFIAYRGELKTPPVFIPFDQKQRFTNPGFFIVETPDQYYVCTRLQEGNDPKTNEDLQQSQLKQILSYVDKKCANKRVVLMGDLACNRGSQSHALLKNSGFVDTIPCGKETATEALHARLHGFEEEETGDSRDYVLVRDRGSKKSSISTHILPSYLPTENKWFSEALSNHHTLIVDLK